MGKTACSPSSVLVAILGVSCVGGYNKLVGLDQAVDGQWAQVENAYQRRADLVPNLVETVKGAAKFEKDDASPRSPRRARRSARSRPQATEKIANDPEALKRFQQAQDGLSSALSRLLVVSEKYPELKATQAFRDLQVQLEGTENRIAVERMRFNEAAQAFNTARNSFPTVIDRRHVRQQVSPRRPTSRRRPARRPRRTFSSEVGHRARVRRAAVSLARAGAVLLARRRRRARRDADPAGARPTGSPTAPPSSRRRRSRSWTRASATTRSRPGTSCWSTSTTRPAASRSRTGRSRRSSAGRSGARASTTAWCCSSSSDDHRLRIEVGYGLEDRVPDVAGLADHQRRHGPAHPRRRSPTAPSAPASTS